MKTKVTVKVLAVIMSVLFPIYGLESRLVQAQEPISSEQLLNQTAPFVPVEQTVDSSNKGNSNPEKKYDSTDFLLEGPLSSVNEVEAEAESTLSAESENLVKIQEGSYDFLSSEEQTDGSPLSEPQTSADLLASQPIQVTGDIATGTTPWEIVSSLDGKEMYVAVKYSNIISVIDTATNTILKNISVGVEPEALALSKDGTKLYVGQQGGNISVIDTASKTVVQTINIGGPVRDLAISPDGTKLYVPMEFSGLKVVDLATNAIKKIQSTGCPEHVSFSPDGVTAYVNTQCGPGGSDPILIYNVVTDTLIGSITTLPDGSRIRNVGSVMTMSPDGSQLWANGSNACAYGSSSSLACPSSNSIIINVIRTSDNTVVKSLFGNFWKISFSADSSLAFVGGPTELRIYDTKTFELKQTLSLSSSGSLAFSVDGRKAYTPLPIGDRVTILSMPFVEEAPAPADEEDDDAAADDDEEETPENPKGNRGDPKTDYDQKENCQHGRGRGACQSSGPSAERIAFEAEKAKNSTGPSAERIAFEAEKAKNNPGRRPEMLDPYGHAKDDRKEIYGNRGRVVRDKVEPAPQPELPPAPTTYLDTNYVRVDQTTWLVREQWWIYSGMTYEQIGYSTEEADFLRSLTRDQMMDAYYSGFVAMPSVEEELMPIAEMDLNQILDYIQTDGNFYRSYATTEATQNPDVYVDGSEISYHVSLTNPYDEAITLMVEVTLHAGVKYATTNQIGFAYPLSGESTQVWQSITLQPGQTLVLDDVYVYSKSMTPSNGWTTYQFNLKLTDLNSGLTLSDPDAGWFYGDTEMRGF